MAKALIITVGGTPQPLIKTILEHRPLFVCFLASHDSVEVIAKVKEGLGEFHIRDRKVIVDDVNDLVESYTKALQCVRHIEAENISPDDVIVDYTGGTKSMSVAVGLACISRGYRFSYVGGTERTKGGLGVVVDGSEQIRTGLSPWALFAVEERRRVADLFNTYQFAAANSILQALVKRNVIPPADQALYQALQKLCLAYSAWERFAHRETVDHLVEGEKLLAACVEIGGRNEYAGALAAVRENVSFLRELQNASYGFQYPCRELVDDLLANAARRAEEGKYDDAVARLYRTLELAGQIALAEPPLRIKSSSDVPESSIPEPLRDEYKRRYTDSRDGKIKLPLFAVFRLLGEVGHSMGLAFKQYEESLQDILSSRNASILAHGLTPVKPSTYESLRDKLCAMLNRQSSVKFPRLPA